MKKYGYESEKLFDVKISHIFNYKMNLERSYQTIQKFIREFSISVIYFAKM